METADGLMRDWQLTRTRRRMSLRWFFTGDILNEPPRRSSTTVYHFFAGDFNYEPIRWDGATEAESFSLWT